MSKPTKTSPKKPVAVKKPAKTAVKSSAKAAPKPSAKTATAKTKKTIAKTKTKPGSKPTVASLSTALKSLESRLKRADTMNRKAVKALEIVVSDLTTRTSSNNTAQKARLTRGLTAIEAQLEAHVAKANQTAQASVRAALSSVTAPGAGLDTLEHALAQAHARLDAQDEAQRTGLAKLNAHLSDLARAVEARFDAQSQTQAAAFGALDQRIDQVELDTAEALERIGDKVAEFADVLADRSQRSDAQTAERLADLAQETQSEFDGAQTQITARLEALEVVAASWDPQPIAPYQEAANQGQADHTEDPRVEQMGQTLSQMQDELSRLHARLADVQARQGGAQSNVVAMTPALAPAVPQAAPSLQTLRDDNPYAAAPQAPIQEVAPQPAPQEEMPRSTAVAGSHFPVEFDPSAFVSAPAAPPAAPQYEIQNAPTATASRSYLEAPIPSAAPMAAPLVPEALRAPTADIAPPFAPPVASAGGYRLPQAELPQSPELPPQAQPLMPTAPAPVETYADPAYAEQTAVPAQDARSGDMIATRVTDDSKARKISLPISKSHLRLGAMAAGVAVLGVFAAKTVLGGTDDTPTATPMASVDTSAPTLTQAGADPVSPLTVDLGTVEPSVAINSSTPQPVLEPPQGDYTGQSAPEVSAKDLTTLQAAVEAGNPIAQFQLGLAKLQEGQPEEAARLIRLAANRNQPAAQYRLAKLYESGTGVAQDLATARELVERAAQGGNRIAMHDLGIYYTSNTGGIEPDMATAAAWFDKAAQRGVVDSQFNIAMLSEGGNGIAADLETAYFWYAIAARQGDQGAPGRLAGVASQLSESARARIQARADAFSPTPVDEAANGVFTNTPWITTPVAETRSAKITQIREAQTLLTALGFEIGSADGAAGPKTRAAVREFQKVNGLNPSGKITPELVERLQIATGT